jgi:hypothetical protein
MAFYLMASSKKGVSAHQLQRALELDYKSAWFMATAFARLWGRRPCPRLAAAGTSQRPMKPTTVRPNIRASLAGAHAGPNLVVLTRSWPAEVGS